jgi:tellurite resistance protein TehA-like permease
MRNFSPAYFGMAMATGIVGIDASVMGLGALAHALLVFNVGLYGVLWTLTGVRFARHRGAFFADLCDHLRAPGFFTQVAATGVIGSQLVVLTASYRAAIALWLLAVVLWIVLTYGIFAALTVKEDKPALDKGLNGGWLLAVVAPQSIAVLSALLAAHLAQPLRLALNFIALSLWLWGGMLYIWLMSLVIYRYLFFRFAPGDLAPPYWINMGAMAISTLAGSLLILNAGDAPFLTSLLPFLRGFTVLYWATGTWWIPMLVVLAVWRYGYRRFPLRYDPLYWGAVFPLGMYAAATHYMSAALGLEFLSGVPSVFFWIALAAWSAALCGLALHLVRSFRARRAID